MEKLVKRHKIITINWACPVFPLASFTVALVGKNTEKYVIRFVTTIFPPLSLPSPFHIKVYNARACSKTKTIVSA